ncbi:MAG: DNA-binding response regulator [Beijerinckiaceae bacterium]|nr:DNA-binding response regulator [Beijerinckiaceae bacterium]
MTPKPIVLVVDDSPATLGMLNDTLEAAGFTVLIAQSGLTAMQLVERITPDIVLMDALMPEMDGFEACRRMKQIKALASVPIVFMTGLTESQDVIRGLEAGGVDYVTKPVAPDEVVARINVHLANARLTRSAHAALDVTGRFLLACDHEGRVLWSTPQAAEILGQKHASGQPVLPEAVRAWVVRCPNMPAEPGLATPLAIISHTGTAGQHLEISYVGRTGPDELLLRVVAADRSSEELLLKQRLGLTTREAEVLLWVGRGKTNRDIAEILSLSPRTVNKHLEVIYAKIGVENRSSAAGIAIRTVGMT